MEDETAESVVEAFRGLNANFMVQEFIKEAGGADIRCFVIGDRVVASMMRKGKEGEFRSNLHRGGSASLVKITPEERRTAVRSAQIMGLNVAGIDLLRSRHGPVVMAVEILPAELPRESSAYFSRLLKAYVPAITNLKHPSDFEHLHLPPEIKRAIILWHGRLTPEYKYLEAHLEGSATH